MIKEIIPRIGYFVLILAIVAIATVLYWEIQPSEVFSLKAPITVVPPIAKSGSAVVLTFTYCKLQNVSGVIRTSFISQTAEIFQPQANDYQPKGCHDDLKIPVLLPSSTLVPAGKYRIKFRATYRINPLKTETTDFMTDEFEIQ